MKPLERPRILGGLVLVCLGATLGWGRTAEAAEGIQTESRMPYRHIIPLRDIDGNMITLPPAVDEQGKAQEPRGNPYSTAQTCGKCHDYGSISSGWHFNAGSTNIPAGRPGEPWILTDPATKTQIPLSYRGWTGTFKPGEIGMSDYDFLLQFARHMPGGGVGEPAKDRIVPTDPKLRRMLVTGTLEIDCLICHDKHGEYDHEARFKAVTAENFRWSATIASELGVYGAARSAKAFADGWRPPRPAPTNLPPIKYVRERFDAGNHVAMDVTRKPPVNNCYYCHTSESNLGDSRWHSDGDVHIRAGMSCVDCHRNAIDHMIVRGYEGETKDRVLTDDMIALRAKLLTRDQPSMKAEEASKAARAALESELGRAETLSCRGCHYGSEDGTQLGRLGAPAAAHKGFPPIHFEKLTCTACHSGPIPQDATEIVHTSLAHKLGLPAPTRGEKTAPQIVQPVFLRDSQGKIGPHKMVWPSFWGRLNNGKVTPMLPEEVSKGASDKLPTQSSEDAERDPYNTRPLTETQIKEVLTALSGSKTNGEPVFVASGKLFQLDGGNLKSGEHAAAQPYAWALGHDVRPASQALGVKGCSDCHASDSPIYFASVAARGPLDPKDGITKDQLAMRGDDRAVVSTFAFTFNFRPLLKVMVFACALALLAVLVGRGLAWAAGIHRQTK